MSVFTIGIAEQKIAKGTDKIATLGLGSCLGLVLYDASGPTAGMVHIMLPNAPQSGEINKHKFADTAIYDLIEQLIWSGVRRSNLMAKVAGGAHMFSSAYHKDIINIGQRNIEVCRRILKESGIPLISEDVGGSSGRSIEFSCDTHMLQIRTLSPMSTKQI